MKPVILSVEYDDINYLVANISLSMRGFDVRRARTGLEAIDCVSNSDDISLVLMEIRLPELSGYDAVRRIKEIKPSIPVIALTADAFEEDKERALSAGCNDYMSKPYRATDLLLKVCKQLGLD